MLHEHGDLRQLRATLEKGPTITTITENGTVGYTILATSKAEQHVHDPRDRSGYHRTCTGSDGCNNNTW